MKAVIRLPSEQPPGWASLPARFPTVTFVFADSDAAAVEAIGAADAYFSPGANIPPELIAAGAQLRWIQVLSAGVERLLATPGLAARGITVTNARVLLGTHVAETGIALLTGLTRGVHFAVRDQLQQRWNNDHPYDELTGKRALIVGAGGIGRALARRLAGLEVQVRAVDVRPSEPDEYISDVRPIDELPGLLPDTDVLAICCPHTAETNHLIDAGALHALPADAYLINVSRGPVVSIEALITVLNEGHLRGVGLDVVEGEPLPADHPLWQFPNVIITPHVGGRSPLRNPRIIELVVDNIQRYLAGQALRNVVDLAAGF